MKNINSKLAIGIASFLEIILIYNIIFKIAVRNWQDIYIFFIAIVNIMIPFIITKIANIKSLELPYRFQLITVLFISLTQCLGEIMQFYTKFWWWDLFLHGLFGCYGIVIGFHLIHEIILKSEEVSRKRFIIFKLIFSICFTITLGIFWEMFEFLADYFLKTDMVNGGVEDTATDLLITIFGAFFVSIVLYFREMKNKE